MDGNVKIDLDKLPIKRLNAIEESGIEHFSPEIGYEEKRLNMVRRIDFSSVVEKDSKKQKSSKEAAAPPWPWQSLVENLQLAHQELSVIIDIINTVETNDAVTVASMQRPKQLPNEVLSDLAVSAATKLQRFRHLGRYFKQSSKALEQQVAREARFYGSLIRLQQNWKVKRHRLATATPGNEGFTIDLLDNSMSDLSSFSRPSLQSTVRVDHDSTGLLAIQLPSKLCRTLSLEYLGARPTCKSKGFFKMKAYGSSEHPGEVKKEALTDEDVNGRVKESHSILREIHQSNFHEQVFDMVNRESYSASPGVNVTGMREDFLQLAIGQETSVNLCLTPLRKEDGSQTIESTGQTQNVETEASFSDPMGLMRMDEDQHRSKKDLLKRPNPLSLKIYLQHIFYESALVKAKEKYPATRLQMPSQCAGDGCGVLGHFCSTIAHRIFSNKVLSELELLASRVEYLHLLSHPTWHSRTSSWSLVLKVPRSILHVGGQKIPSDTDVRSGYRSQFHTKVMVNDDQISVSGDTAPSICSFGRSSVDVCSINCYGCVLEDLPTILLQQVANQVVQWLYEEAVQLGMKASKDFLGLYFDLEQGEVLGLVAQVDPNDSQGCISWWMVMDNSSSSIGNDKLSLANNVEPINRRSLGHLSLDSLYTMLMDLVSLCSTGGSH